MTTPNPKPRADAETLDLSSVASLRRTSSASRKSGDTAWIRLDGLALDDDGTHAALCHTLTRFGLGAETGRPMPQTVVLDWSSVEHCSAEGVAFFPVIVTHLLEKGRRVIACQPSIGAITAVLDEIGVLAACGPIVWVPCASSGRERLAVEPVAPIAIFSTESNDSVDLFCDNLSVALRHFGLPRRQAAAVMGTTQELIHNVLSHANAAHGAAASLLFPRRRPKVLQIGIADDGYGIPATVFRQERHQWLQWFHDSSITEMVLAKALSGRDSMPQSGSGGGMARIVRHLLREASATVMLRSSAALVALRSTSPDRFEKRGLTFGAGTQVRIELRLV